MGIRALANLIGLSLLSSKLALAVYADLTGKFGREFMAAGLGGVLHRQKRQLVMGRIRHKDCIAFFSLSL